MYVCNMYRSTPEFLIARVRSTVRARSTVPEPKKKGGPFVKDEADARSSHKGSFYHTYDGPN